MNLTPAFPYYASSFSAGALVLFIELAGARWLAPSFGSGLDVWASLLTVTLLALALGAWGGGVLADRNPRVKTLSFLWFAVAASMALLLPFRNPLLNLTQRLAPGWGALLSAMGLYLPALVLLAAVAPLAVRLAAPTPETVGRVVGRYSAVGTAGSCLGALVTGFVLVPQFPLTRLFAGASLTAALVGLVLLPGALRRAAPVASVLIWAGFLFILSTPRPFRNLAGEEGVLMIQDVRQSLYGQVRVMETSSSRYLFLDGILQGGQEVRDGTTIASYSMMMEALGRAIVPRPQRVLVVGLGAAILPNRMKALGAHVDVVEINPQVADVAQKWFGFSPGPGELHVEDGRHFLRDAQGPYDLIFLDTFSGEEVPGHLVTVETFRRCRELLGPQGALVLNYIGTATGPRSAVPGAVAATLKRAFGSVEMFALGKTGERDNLAMVARPEAGPWGAVPTDVPGPPEERGKLPHLLEYQKPIPPSDKVFTDDWHPLDWLDRLTRQEWRQDAMQFMNQYGVDG